jgi:nicotinate dehydrogenase subunit B
MRHEGHGWDPKGPASVHTGRAVLDDTGRITALEFASRAFSRTDVDSNESNPQHSLAGQMMGLGVKPTPAFGAPEGAYEFAAKRLTWETIAPLLAAGSPLRTSHLRDPVGPQLIFGYESFIDEVAHTAKADPVDFRLKHLTDTRAIAVIKAAAEKFGWQPRAAASNIATGDLMTGRGIAYAQRGRTVVAIIAEVTVSRSTGQVRPTRYVVAHECGLIVNPDGLRRTIEGNIVHASSRSLHEEVVFDDKAVTSIDWLTYPILDMTEAPATIDIVLIDRPERPALGAGEATTRPVAAAIGNAIFDATGIRMRRAPFTADRMKRGLGLPV